MNPVTDPNLIAQLEGGSTAGQPQPVTDPALIAQLESNPQAFPGSMNFKQTLNFLSQNSPMAAPLGSHPIADVNAGISKFKTGVINNYDRLTGQPVQPNPDIAAYMGAFGDKNPTGAGQTIAGLSEYAPYGVAALISPASAVAANAAYGSTNVNHPVLGAMGGAALSLMPGAAHAISPLAKTALNSIRPQAAMNDILQNLGNGQSLEGNAQSLAQSLKAAYEKNASAGNELYDPIMKPYGQNSIYENALPENSAYKALDKDVLSSDTRLKKLNQQFSDNPTLDNAHTLQSQLGTAIRKLETNDAKGTLSIADRNTLYGYQDAQNAVKKDMMSFLNSKDPALANQYQAASANWAQNVVPYTETPKLAQIVKGDIVNPTPAQIQSIFKNPEPEIQKVVSDMGPKANAQILYNHLGKTNYLKPEDLVKAAQNLDKQGLGSYVTPELDEQLNTLSNRIRNRNYAVKGGGAAAVSAGIPTLYHWVKHALSGGL